MTPLPMPRPLPQYEDPWFPQWWDHAWEGWNVWSQTINFGSVADWVAGIGTVLAFGLGLLILWRDRKKEERKFADQFITWFDATKIGVRPDAKGKRPATVVVHVHNAGLVMIPFAVLDVIHRGLTHRLYQLGVGADPHMIEPGANHTREFKFGDLPNQREFFVFIKDGSGGSWWRQIETGKYISRKAFSRLQKHPDSRRARRWLKTN